MELKDFIQTSLREILAGVRAAAAEDNAIAPASIEGEPIWTERLITFEVNVVTDATAKSGLKVIQIVEAGGEIKRTKANKLAFSVPVHMNVRAETRGSHA